MKTFLVFLASIALVAVVDGLSPGFRVRFNIGISELFGNFGTSSFYNLPENVTEAKNRNWTLETPATSYLADYLTLYCYIDKIICVYFDDTEYPVGMQYSVPKSNFTNNKLDFATRGYTAWTTLVNGISQDYWAISLYLTDEERLQTSKAARLATHSSSSLLQDYIWLTGFNGAIDKIPTSTTNISTTTLFKEQRCVPWMEAELASEPNVTTPTERQHYHYNMTPSLECVAEQIYSWFLLTDSGNLIGVGLASFGEMTVGDGQRNWYETAPTLAIRYIVKSAPECLYEMVSDPGIVATHIYFVSDPWKIGC